eukprot:CAMPEP_0197482008 /NCGR_PEP_ID=MMETSP1309-20131121/51067_1 /TAXON_ID=464262 /ORGANISM="Genus nov. species nov., Strain RCC998" /LENGTH=132 /DNA_ID=CAMNT_0043024411 /DNA_START=418 /DNA_END=816 /DNA_ORIENTATION=-
MPLHSASEPLPFGGALHVYKLPDDEVVRINRGAGFQNAVVSHLELDNFPGNDRSFVAQVLPEVSDERFVYILVAFRASTHLYSDEPSRLISPLDLDHSVLVQPQHRERYADAVRVPLSRHAALHRNRTAAPV